MGWRNRRRARGRRSGCRFLKSKRVEVEGEVEANLFKLNFWFQELRNELQKPKKKKFMTPERKKKLRQAFCIMMVLHFYHHSYHHFSGMKHIINSYLHGRPPFLPFNHQLLMREAAKQLKIEQEKKEAERRKVIFFTELFVIFSFVIIIIFKNDKMARA